MRASALLLLALLRLGVAATAGGPDGGQHAQPLKPLLHIDWRRLPDFPKQGPERSGVEASNGGWVSGDVVIAAFGYASGGASLGR
jgi:hypothetical protein